MVGTISTGFFSFNNNIYLNVNSINFTIVVRRRLAAKKRKLKVAGKSKSTDTEDESTFDYCDDEGNLRFCNGNRNLVQFRLIR